MNEQAPQWIESDRLLTLARQRGYVADRLRGPREMHFTPQDRGLAMAAGGRGSIGGRAGTGGNAGAAD